MHLYSLVLWTITALPRSPTVLHWSGSWDHAQHKCILNCLHKISLPVSYSVSFIHMYYTPHVHITIVDMHVILYYLLSKQSRSLTSFCTLVTLLFPPYTPPLSLEPRGPLRSGPREARITSSQTWLPHRHLHQGQSEVYSHHHYHLHVHKHEIALVIFVDDDDNKTDYPLCMCDIYRLTLYSLIIRLVCFWFFPRG